ncbi:TIGR02453 family protein [Pseudahrensia aquimaris]|uniref:TIGR02453 family protein n=1 Tax=Pseudahrensia aquimaris TaxID=744461 RepID=A0ABW3FJF0_9HYPH
MAFEGFGKNAMPFFKALAFHQNREWFLENKKLYEQEAREPMVALVETLSERFEKEGLPFRGSRKTSLFRINRDVRFSKEKHPYKTNVTGVLTRTGTKKDVGGIYMHFDPEGSFPASGLWFPPSPELKAMRGQIVARWKDFKKLAADLEEAGTPLGLAGGQGVLTRPPKGFADIEDEELMGWLKRKSFVAQLPIDEKRLTSPDLVEDVVAFGHTIMPFMNFVWRATDPLREEDGAA